MDPNEVLRKIRELMAPLHPDCGGKAGDYDLVSGDDYDEHTDAVWTAWEDLDHWLSTGGFLPEAWERKSKVPTTEEAFAAGIRGEAPDHFAMRVATALTKEYADHQKRILRSLDRSPKGVMLDTEDQMACIQLEELGLVAGGDYVLADYGDWRYYFITKVGVDLVKAWRQA